MRSWKESKLYSIVTVKCPKCHKGNMFPAGTLYQVTKFDKMYESCPCCNQTFEPEPGYYYGAMFVSYGITTAIFFAVLAALSFFVDEITMTMVLLSITGVVVTLTPIIFRLSRSIWINIFMSYSPEAAQKC